MADTGGIAALLKALDSTPGLGAGLKPSSKTTPKSSDFAATAGIGKTSDLGGTVETGAPAAPAAIRITRPKTLSVAARTKTVVADGQAYDAKAPRGSYVDIVV